MRPLLGPYETSFFDTHQLLVPSNMPVLINQGQIDVTFTPGASLFNSIAGTRNKVLSMYKFSRVEIFADGNFRG